ncbi:hypothetical protein BUALT_Bualt10G0094400 [Buddleja alternifolia]|uniref:Cytochrome P450 n=1 Tax=Buddleja alternifolia TaxID=168488 RepID=A0AAV6WZ21_9LAMI|nr:hypothetical protein BUALT_Bualt10G0094400 [Buddleja alternifolia]
MDFITLLLVPIFLYLAWFHFLRSKSNSSNWKTAKLAPGPYPFPIIGNILQLGQSPHRSLTKLSKTYGPLMSLQLGSIYTVVLSSPEMAKEILKKHDQVFSSRTIASAAEAHDHDKMSLGYLPVGAQWKKFRKICREQMFSTLRLEESHGLRQDKLNELREYLHKCSVDGRAVNIGEAAFITTLNLMSATLFSATFAEFDSDAVEELKESIEGVARIVALPNFGDYFPVLKPFDLQGIKRKAEVYFGKLLVLIEDMINQRLEKRTSVGYQKKKDLLEALLDLSEGSEYELSCYEIKHLLLVRIFFHYLIDAIYIGHLATLIRNFDWKFEFGIKSKEVDMKEKFGLSLRKEIPLKAIPLEL